MANHPVYGNLPQSTINQINNHQIALRVSQTTGRKKQSARNRKPDYMKDLTRTISIAELKDLIRDNLTALWERDSDLCTEYSGAELMIPPIMVWGPPGLGKSAAVKELCCELGIGFIDIRLSQRDPTDLKGLPVPDGDKVDWLLSSEWPRDPESRGIILFDEVTAADRMLQVSAYQIVMDRKLGGYTVPRGWYIMAAGNRSEDRAVSTGMSSALANRLLHVSVGADVRSFLDWAKNVGRLHPAVIEFIKTYPQHLFSQKGEDLQRGWPTPRSWTRVSTMVKIAEKTGKTASLNYTVPGLVGAGAGAEFLAFYHTVFYRHKDLDIAAMLENGQPIPIPEKPDELYACCGAVAYYLEAAKPGKKFEAVSENFLKFVASLPADFAAMIMNDVESRLGDQKRFETIISHPLFATVKLKYSAVEEASNE